MSLPPIQDMAIFAHVVEAQGFTAAAERLGLSKSAVSKAVASLEAHLGVRLLHRTTRKLRLTEAGASFHGHCANILAAAAAAEAAVGHGGEPRGRVKLNVPTALAKTFVLPVVLSVQERYPELEVDLVVQDEMIDLVATGTDLAVRVGRLVDAALVARKLAPVRAFLVASAAYLARAGTPASPEELAQHRFIRYTLSPRPDRVTLDNGEGERAVVRMSGALLINNGDVVLEAVLAGVGIGVLPDFLGTEAYCDGRLQVVLPRWHLAVSAIYAVYPQGGPVTPAVRLIIDALVERAEALKRAAGDRPFALALRDV